MAFMFNDDKTKLTVGGSQGILLAAYNTQSEYFDPDFDPAYATHTMTASVDVRDQTKSPVIFDILIWGQKASQLSNTLTIDASSVGKYNDKYVASVTITAKSGNDFTIMARELVVLIQEA